MSTSLQKKKFSARSKLNDKSCKILDWTVIRVYCERIAVLETLMRSKDHQGNYTSVTIVEQQILSVKQAPEEVPSNELGLTKASVQL